MKEMFKIFTRNNNVKIVVTCGEKTESFNFGSVDCTDFTGNLTCIKLGHNFDSGIVTLEATCNTEGTRIFTCLNCGATQNKTIAPLGHNFVNEECDRCIVGRKGPAGGIIFYDCNADNDVGNPDGLISDECGWQYLEVAPFDIKVDNTDNFIFGYYRKTPEDDNRYVSGYTKYSKSNCTQTVIGSGKKNTEMLVNAMGNSAYTKSNGNETTSNYAAKLCDDFVYGDYDDWFLPSLDEIIQIINLGPLKNLHLPYYYEGLWTSSETEPNYTDENAQIAYISYSHYEHAYAQTTKRDGFHKVRAIRAF